MQRKTQSEEKSSWCGMFFHGIKKTAGHFSQVINLMTNSCSSNGTCATHQIPLHHGIFSENNETSYTDSYFSIDSFSPNQKLGMMSFSFSFLCAIPESLMSQLLTHFHTPEDGIFIVNQAIKALGLWGLASITPDNTLVTPVATFIYIKTVAHFGGDEKTAGAFAAAIAIGLLLYWYGPTTVLISLTTGGIGHLLGKKTTELGVDLTKIAINQCEEKMGYLQKRNTR